MICPHCHVDIQPDHCGDAMVKLQSALIDKFPGHYEISTADSVADVYIGIMKRYKMLLESALNE